MLTPVSVPDTPPVSSVRGAAVEPDAQAEAGPPATTVTRPSDSTESAEVPPSKLGDAPEDAFTSGSAATPAMRPGGVGEEFEAAPLQAGGVFAIDPQLLEYGTLSTRLIYTPPFLPFSYHIDRAQEQIYLEAQRHRTEQSECMQPVSNILPDG